MSGHSAVGEKLSRRTHGGSRPACSAGSRLQLTEHGVDPQEPTRPGATTGVKQDCSRSADRPPRQHPRRRLLRLPIGSEASGASVVRKKRRNMLNKQTIEKLYVMRMRGMADGFRQQQEEPQTMQLSFEERFALLVDRQWNWRQNRALERRLKEGRLQGPACVED